jgi:hypothetical protein
MKNDEIYEACSMNGNEEKCIQNFVKKQKERDNLEALVLQSKIILKMDAKEIGKAWTGFVWLRIGTSVRLL